MIKLILFMLLFGIIANADSGAQVASRVHVGSSDAQRTAWMHAMEARFDDEMVASEALPTWREVGAWLGWAIAAISLFMLGVVHLRERRHTSSLLRAGERDEYLWRRPR